MTTTIAKASAGSILQYSLDNTTFTKVAQLKSIKPAGSKQTIVDQTNILTALPFTALLAARVDSGEIDIEGVLDPANGTQLGLGQLHANLTLAWWKILLSDGTQWSFQGLVSGFKPFEVDVAKAIIFAAKLRISGALTGPLGSA
jgi:hypothetical protein